MQFYILLKDPHLIPMDLHDCVDSMVSMKTWKCIRRAELDRISKFIEMLKNQSHDQTKSLNMTSDVGN